MSIYVWIRVVFLIFLFSPILDILAVRKMERDHPEWFNDSKEVSNG